MTDLEISSKAIKEDIKIISKKANIDEKYLECYGNDKAKINLEIMKEKNKDGKLILVTSINPTPYGEGKTTMSIGLNDALCKINKDSIVVLRQPSLGPVFGIKGGATGGGYSQVIPMEDINIHFTGDIHAIESCNNLLCAIIDNHIYQGNSLNIKKVVFNRCVDLNDRALRNVTIHYDNKGLQRKDNYNITVASEIMAILCLSKDMVDLKVRLGNIIIGYNSKNTPIFAKDLNCVGALAILLKDAIKPNLVQTLENNPALIHGGPFANIAHGCNSIIATKMALKLKDYVVTEAGFGSDLGAEKFLDIKCPIANIKPNVIVINTTIRSLKYNGESSNINTLDMNALKKGICNLKTHILNMQKYTKNVIVCLNRFEFDNEEEIEYVREYVNNMNVLFSISTSFKDGSKGSIDLANKVVELCNNEVDYKPLYDYNDTIINKINTIIKNIYHAKDVIIDNNIQEKIKQIEDLKLDKLPICIAKTQYSLSDNPKLLGSPEDFTMKITDIKLSNGAGFIVVLMGNIMTLPGLSKNPAYCNMDINNNYEIKGIF